MRRMLAALVCLGAAVILSSAHAETWQAALSKMPLVTNLTELNRTNALRPMLESFQSNGTVKALIFMPGATDEFFMFRRARAQLTNASPTLLDAVIALTNQTFIRATFRDHFLLLHTVQDPLEPLVTVRDRATAKALGKKQCEEHFEFYDKDWDYILPHLGRGLKTGLAPGLYSTESFHFYRHSFAAWHLTGAEAMRAVALAGKTKYLIDKGVVYFQPDPRMMAPAPDLQNFRLR